MSFRNEIDGNRRCPSTGCCGNNCASGESNCEACISSCNCQSNVGYLNHGACSGLRPTGTAATAACPGSCQCVEEEIWNSNVPPKSNYRWLNNFTELRRQWSDHGRQQAYKCRCSRPCRTVASCRPCLSATAPCSGTILLTSDCQKCCGSRRLAGGASKSEMAPVDKSSSPEPLKREAGGGCPPSSCSYPSTRYNSPNAECSSTASSCCSSQCRYPSSRRTSDCQPCALKSILKKRNCCHSNTNSYCLCQPIPRGCNCPPPIQVDARATHECSCDCPSSPECACPPSERRFPKATIKCPNARLCCPSPQLPPSPKYHCPCQPRCPPSPCNPCTSFKCRRPVSTKDSCQPNSPCPSCPPRRPISTTSSCRPPTPCRKLTFCTERNDRLSSPCTGQSWREITGDKISESSICNEQNDDKAQETYKKDSNYCYATDRAESEDEFKYADQNRNLILDEESIQNSTSKTFINLTETTNPSKSVDPDSCDVPEQKDEIAFENATKAFEACTTEKSSKDSWYTPSCTHIPSDSGTKSDCCVFREEYPAVGGNVSGNPVLARLLSRMKSFNRVRDLLAPNKTLLRHSVTFRDVPRARVRLLADASISKSNPTTTSTRGIDRRRRNGGSLKEDTSSLPREN
ncbi:PREDICTED: extracellular matrix protein A-like isoform X1 [Trachymyrmex cornetzi]|nr:PREDICTED: extracellular matrix protein A-like isoform X1 [Trachymyrmex cornetzi]